MITNSTYDGLLYNTTWLKETLDVPSIHFDSAWVPYTHFHPIYQGKSGMSGERIPGKVIFEGESNLRIAGKWLVVSGFWFRNGCSPTGTVIEYRQGTRHATDCRVTECAIEAFNPESRQTKGNWVQFYGHRNRLDHCSIVGKLNEGVTVTAVLNGSDNQHHRIDNNYFGPRGGI